jgi:hypothetical protein
VWWVVAVWGKSVEGTEVTVRVWWGEEVTVDFLVGRRWGGALI